MIYEIYNVNPEFESSLCRVFPKRKKKSRKRILDAAARLIRENGVEATSVADVMTAAGMTHGGFYRHFANKDELVRAAFQEAVDRSVGAMDVPETEGAREEARKRYVATYLSQEHVESRGQAVRLPHWVRSLGVAMVRQRKRPQPALIGLRHCLRMGMTSRKDTKNLPCLSVQ